MTPRQIINLAIAVVFILVAIVCFAFAAIKPVLLVISLILACCAHTIIKYTYKQINNNTL